LAFQPYVVDEMMANPIPPMLMVNKDSDYMVNNKYLMEYNHQEWGLQ
jgi:hypothetical protein